MYKLLTVFAIFLAGCMLPSEPEVAGSGGTTYRCASGRTVRITYSSADVVILEYDGRTIHMERVVSGSGTRYANSELIWHANDREGSLSRTNAAQDLVETCTRN